MDNAEQKILDQFEEQKDILEHFLKWHEANRHNAPDDNRAVVNRYMKLQWAEDREEVWGHAFDETAREKLVQMLTQRIVDEASEYCDEQALKANNLVAIPEEGDAFYDAFYESSAATLQGLVFEIGTKLRKREM